MGAPETEGSGGVREVGVLEGWEVVETGGNHATMLKISQSKKGSREEAK